MNNQPEEKEYWETESYPIAIDSCCSVSIAKQKADFVGNILECDITTQASQARPKSPQKVHGNSRYEMTWEQNMKYSFQICYLQLKRLITCFHDRTGGSRARTQMEHILS